ncbi:protein MCM10 [Hordeum vulgare]|nr:protein MCM10 [Hordeum vulgare]
MADADDDLDLLLSLDEDGNQAVLDTPPYPPPLVLAASTSYGAFTPLRAMALPGCTDKSVVHDAVKDYIEVVQVSNSDSGPSRPSSPNPSKPSSTLLSPPHQARDHLAASDRQPLRQQPIRLHLRVQVHPLLFLPLSFVEMDI